MRRFSMVALTGVMLTACTSVNYTPPSSKNISPNTRLVNESYDQAWDALVDHVSQTFFAIDNFERATGLMTLTFGASSPSKFVDCGLIKVKQGQINFDGPYIDFLERYNNAELTGRMNLLVQRVSDYSTEVKINTRYVITVPSHSTVVAGYWGPVNTTVPGNSFSFDSGGSDTVNDATNLILGPSRTCRATGVAESEILSAIGG